MYSKKTIELTLDRMEKKLGWRPQPTGYHLTRSRVEDLNSLLGPKGELRRPLAPEENRWILNERLMCMADFLYWATRFAYIIDKFGNLINFNPNIAQNICLDLWGSLEDQRVAIAIDQLKARQLGISTLCELAIAHRVQFHSYTRAIVGSSDPDKSMLMSAMMEVCFAEQPWWLMPRQTKFERGKYIEFGDMHCSVSIQHGTQRTGIGRGATPTAVHLSECADFENPEEIVEASILRAMHESPKMFLVLESTAKRIGGWWHKTWKFSKEQGGMSRLTPCFLPWFVGRDLYPTEAWLRKRPVPENWEPKKLTIEHAIRAEKYAQADPVLRKHLGVDWQMPREQMWWWEVSRAEAEEKNLLAQFSSELPADDEAAFTNANPSALSIEVISDYRERTLPPVAVYGFEGPQDLFPMRYWPVRRERDETKPRIQIRANWNQAEYPFECELVPIKFNGYAATPAANKLFVWEPPKNEEEYGLGVDVSEGSGLDNSAVEVLRKGNIYRPDCFVAELVSPDMNALDLWPFCMAIGSWYSVKYQGSIRQPRQVIECAINGESTQLELKKRGWSNFHVWFRTDRKRIDLAGATRLGWFTTAWSRPLMMDWVLKAIIEGWVDMPSPELVSEFAALEKVPTETRFKMQASYGNKDDRVMAAAMVFYSLHILGKRGEMHSAAYRRVREQAAQVQDPVFVPPMPQRNGGRALLPEETQAILTATERRWSRG